MANDWTKLSLEERALRYRTKAELAIRAANSASDATVRLQLLEVATGWHELADLMERSLREQGR